MTTEFRPVDASGVRNVRELVARIAALFHCMDGLPRAYFEFDSGARDYRGDIVRARIEYKTAAFGVQGDDEVTNEATLCTEFWRYILARTDGCKPGHILFWRRRPVLETIRHELAVDDAGRTEEMCEDGGIEFIPALGPKTSYLRARLEIPGFDLGASREGLGPVMTSRVPESPAKVEPAANLQTHMDSPA